MPVSSKTGEGLDTLLETLRTLCQPLTPRSTQGPVRLPIDRVFIMRGFGVVVTGTLFSGSLHLEDRVEVLPQRETARVRGLQVHNQSVPEAVAGQRTAVNVQGLERTALQRGDVLVTPGRFPVTYMLDVTLTLLAQAPRPLKHRDRVRFHIGTSEIMGRVILLDRDEVQPGEEVFAQLHLEEPAIAAPQDRYVLRSYSPIQTIAGGVILDTLPAKHRRRRPQVLEHSPPYGMALQRMCWPHLANAEYAACHGLIVCSVVPSTRQPCAPCWRTSGRKALASLLTTTRRGYCTGSNMRGGARRSCSYLKSSTARIL